MFHTRKDHPNKTIRVAVDRNPYASPSAAVDDVLPPIHDDKFSRWVRWFLYLQIGITVISIVCSVLEYGMLRDFAAGVYASEDEARVVEEASDMRLIVVGAAQTLIFLVGGILILRWIYRANVNARRLGAGDLHYTPGWSVGWYFVPFANLWKPFRALKQIWLASEDPKNWVDDSGPVILRWWWFFWLVSNFVSNASLRLTARSDEIGEMIAANVLSQIADITSIPLCALFLVIVARVDSMQAAAEKVKPTSLL